MIASDEDGEYDCDEEENNIAGLNIRGPSGDRQHPSSSHVFAPSLESYALKMMMCHDRKSSCQEILFSEDLTFPLSFLQLT